QQRSRELGPPSVTRVGLTENPNSAPTNRSVIADSTGLVPFPGLVYSSTMGETSQKSFFKVEEVAVVAAALLNTDLEGLPKKSGKVRDIYDLGDRLLILATDRI